MLFIETSTFTRELPRHFDDDAYAALQDVPQRPSGHWGCHPQYGWHPQDPLDNAGKRGGSRVVYYWLAKEDHIYLLTLYAKGVKDDLTGAERDAWRKAVEAINND